MLQCTSRPNVLHTWRDPFEASLQIAKSPGVGQTVAASETRECRRCQVASEDCSRQESILDGLHLSLDSRLGENGTNTSAASFNRLLGC